MQWIEPAGTLLVVQSLRGAGSATDRPHVMPLLDRLFPRRVSAAQIEQVSQQLPRVAAAPETRSLKCISESSDPGTVADWLHWSAWQDKQNRQVWVHCTGGVAGVDVWFGPGDPSLAAALGAA